MGSDNTTGIPEFGVQLQQLFQGAGLGFFLSKQEKEDKRKINKMVVRQRAEG